MAKVVIVAGTMVARLVAGAVALSVAETGTIGCGTQISYLQIAAN